VIGGRRSGLLLYYEERRGGIPDRIAIPTIQAEMRRVFNTVLTIENRTGEGLPYYSRVSAKTPVEMLRW